MLLKRYCAFVQNFPPLKYNPMGSVLMGAKASFNFVSKKQRKKKSDCGRVSNCT